MAEHFMFFDSENPLQPDRTYNAQEFTDYFKALVTTGIMKGTGNQLKVSANGSTMISTIDTGIAFLLGRYYENDSLLALTHETEAIGKNRIDRVVIRMDLGTNARNVKAFVKKGAASTTPVPPSLIQSPNLYEISIAQVLIEGGQTFIDSISVTDERGKDIICPWAGSKILPNFDDAALEDLVNKVNATEPAIKTAKEEAVIQAVARMKISEPWKVPVLQNGWLSVVNDPIGYFKDELGFVHIQGSIEGGTNAVLTTLFTLPEGYRPIRSNELRISGVNANTNGHWSGVAFRHGAVSIMSTDNPGTISISAIFRTD